MQRLIFTCLLLAAVMAMALTIVGGAIENQQRHAAARAYFKWKDVPEHNGKDF